MSRRPILILRALGVGDLLTAVPALRALRRAYPDRQLLLAAPDWLAPLVELTDTVDRLVPVDGVRSLDGWTAYRWSVPAPELAVNLHGRGPQSHRLLAAAHPHGMLAFACPAAGHRAGPRWVDGEREVDRWCRLLRAAGIVADPDDLGLRVPPPDRAPVEVSVLHVGAKDPARRWPPARFAAVATALTAAGHSVVITGSAAEVEAASRVAAVAGLPASAVLAGGTDLTALAALVAHARVVVSGDTGVAHLATAYGTPSVVLFAGMSPAQWGPPADRPWHRAIWHRELADAPPAAAAELAGGVHPALLAVDPEEVLEGVGQMSRADRRASPRVVRQWGVVSR